MPQFEILEHKADLRIRAFGKTKEELFLNMLLGMNKSMKPEVKDDGKTKKAIKVQSLDLPALLVDFLSEVLCQTQVNKEIYNDIKFSKFTDPSTSSGQVVEIEGELIGQKVERFNEDIKAVTYHNLLINQKEDGSWEATVLFDI